MAALVHGVGPAECFGIECSSAMCALGLQMVWHCLLPPGCPSANMQTYLYRAFCASLKELHDLAKRTIRLSVSLEMPCTPKLHALMHLIGRTADPN